jgi:hypothetical protein
MGLKDFLWVPPGQQSVKAETLFRGDPRVGWFQQLFNMQLGIRDYPENVERTMVPMILQRSPHSFKMVWGLAIILRSLGFRCINFHPHDSP